MRKLCLLLAFVLIATLFCACNEEKNTTESGTAAVNNSESDRSGDDVNDRTESSISNESDNAVNTDSEGDTPNEKSGENTGSTQINPVTEEDAGIGCEVPTDFFSQEELEDFFRLEYGTLPTHYIPWQQILPVDCQSIYIVFDGYFADSLYINYAIRDEQGNRWSLGVTYAEQYRDKNILELLGLIFLDGEPYETKGVLSENLLSDQIGITDISENGYYVDNIDDPSQSYYYRDGTLVEIRFLIDGFLIKISTDFDQISGSGDGIQSSSATKITPQSFTSYQGVQNVIKKAGDNIAQYTAQFEATE